MRAEVDRTAWHGLHQRGGRTDGRKVENLVAMHFRGVGGNGRKNLGVDAFDVVMATTRLRW